MTYLRTGFARARAVAIYALLGLSAQALVTPAAARLIDVVRERGHVLCGVSETRGGLSSVDKDGRWGGLEVEFCGALAAGVLGDRKAVRFRAVNSAEGARALKSGDIDVLLGGTVWTMSRETELNMRPAGVLFHDGQALMVPRSFGVSSVLELSGAKICAMKGNGADQTLADYFKSRQMRYEAFVSEKWDDLVKVYASGACTLLIGDLSDLALERSRLAKARDHLILPELISSAAVTPMVREDDVQWLAVVRWTLFGLIHAEELGLTSENVETLRTSAPTEAIRRFLGTEGSLGPSLGLAQDWMYQIVRQTGNYGEMFERTMGSKSRFELARGVNGLWSQGGMMFSPAFR